VTVVLAAILAVLATLLSLHGAVRTAPATRVSSSELAPCDTAQRANGMRFTDRRGGDALDATAAPTRDSVCRPSASAALARRSPPSEHARARTRMRFGTGGRFAFARGRACFAPIAQQCFAPRTAEPRDHRRLDATAPDHGVFATL
jgi:hypothetical protein